MVSRGSATLLQHTPEKLSRIHGKCLMQLTAEACHPSLHWATYVRGRKRIYLDPGRLREDKILIFY